MTQQLIASFSNQPAPKLNKWKATMQQITERMDIVSKQVHSLPIVKE